MFQLFKGQVVQVKPSFMRNYLHNYNGARYILKDTDIDETLLAQSREIEASKNTIDKAANLTLGGKKEMKKEAKSEVAEEKPKPKGILENDITIKDVKIPGLDL